MANTCRNNSPFWLVLHKNHCYYCHNPMHGHHTPERCCIALMLRYRVGRKLAIHADCDGSGDRNAYRTSELITGVQHGANNSLLALPSACHRSDIRTDICKPKSDHPNDHPRENIPPVVAGLFCDSKENDTNYHQKLSGDQHWFSRNKGAV
jgi:hypothetical protein